MYQVVLNKTRYSSVFFFFEKRLSLGTRDYLLERKYVSELMKRGGGVSNDNSYEITRQVG